MRNIMIFFLRGRNNVSFWSNTMEIEGQLIDWELFATPKLYLFNRHYTRPGSRDYYCDPEVLRIMNYLPRGRTALHNPGLREQGLRSAFRGLLDRARGLIHTFPDLFKRMPLRTPFNPR